MPTLAPSTVTLLCLLTGAIGVAIAPWLNRLALFLAEDRPLSTGLHCESCGQTLTWPRAIWPRRCECGNTLPGWPRALTLATVLIYIAFTALYLGWHCQTTPEVRPTAFWSWGRWLHHLLLFTLLIVATATDLRNYTISDLLVVAGLLLGTGLATVSGDLQIVHIWVDWNQEIPGFRGPWLPGWLSEHPHLHGAAWSLAGAAAGTAITWLIRLTAAWMLQKPALGLGDVTLMAMVGSFVGWQPVVLILLLAPLLAITIGIAVWALTGRAFVAFGPYLALATLIVVGSWRWIWMTDLRYVFGHAPSLAILGAAAAGTLPVLLGALRLYQAIPAGEQTR